MIIALITSMLLFCSISSGADNFTVFSHLGSSEGLSNDNITSIYQDEFGMVWIGTNDGLNRYDGQRVEVLRPVPGDSTSIFNNNIKCICGDRKGKIYVISKFALDEYDISTEKFRHIRKGGMQYICCNRGRLWAASRRTVYKLVNGSLEEFCSLDDYSDITSILELSDGRVLIATEADGAFAVDENRKMSRFLEGTYVSGLLEDSKHNLWFCTRYQGLFKLSSNNLMSSYRHGADPGTISDDYVRTLCEDPYGRYWIGTFNGLCVLDPDTRVIKRIDRGSLPSSSIWDIICDRDGAMWVGSRYGGISIWSKSLDIFDSYNFYGDIAEDSRGGLFVASEDNKLIHYDPFTRRTETIDALSEYGFKSLCFDKFRGVLWIGTLRGGLFSMDRRGGITSYRHNEDDPAAIPSEHIHKIIPYGTDSLIVATKRGIVMFSPASGRCRKLFEGTGAERKYVSDIMVDDSLRCWTALSGCVCRTDPATGETREYFVGGSVPELGTSNIQTIFQDCDSQIYLGSTGRGLFVYRPGDETFTCINTHNSTLPNDYIVDIGRSPAGYLLIVTNKGLTRYDSVNGVFLNYNQDNGYPIPNTNAYGVFVASDAHIYLSSFGQTLSFYENDLVVPERDSDIRFVSLTVDNRRVHPGDGSGILRESLLYQDNIVIPAGHNVFSVGCSPISYTSGVGEKFEYRLNGFDDKWIEGDLKTPLTYTNLPPRSYSLEARLVDRQTLKEISHRVLHIQIRPHFYQTVWFFLLLLAAAVAFALFCFNTYASRLRLNSSLEQEKLEKKKIQELNSAKMQFFTYISHEIRTPVTLMTSSVESLLSQGGQVPGMYAKLKGLRDNLGKVTTLINELLDFRKQESGVAGQKFSENDIVLHLAKTETCFREYAQQRDIELTFSNLTGRRSLPLWYDYDQIDKVLTNLLSNAFKHTGKCDCITLELSEGGGRVTVKVTDSGEGIEPIYQKMIFEPFGQVPGKGGEALGTGLGLALCRKIVEAHKGSISVESAPGQGATFAFSLPEGCGHIPAGMRCVRADEDRVNSQELSCIDSDFVEEVKASQAKAGLGRVRMLIVEDNDELRASLADLFEPYFTVTLAVDGLDAIEKIEHSHPDIILSDLMMPNLDGNELCSRVKNNIETSHIPFVLLTAKVSVEAELEGFINGADDYIAKPFNAKVLVRKCVNLVNSRAMLQRKFLFSANMESNELVGDNDIDRQFMDKAMKIIDEHLSDSEFDIDVFAREMAMGRTNFFMKIKGMTGQTPSRFISGMRLKKSLALLDGQPQLTISEVAYMVGFTSPSYFIKSFRELYGFTPSAYKSRKQSSSDDW